MKCLDFKKRVNRYVDGELPEMTLAAMRQHADECLSCRKLLEETNHLSAVLASGFVPDVPPGFAESVMRRARTAGAERQANILWFIPTWWSALTQPARVAAAALLIAGIGLGALMGWDTSQPPVSSVEAIKTDQIAEYKLDYFEEAPEGSLAQVYLALAK